MSKTFTGTVSFTFSAVVTESTIANMEVYSQERINQQKAAPGISELFAGLTLDQRVAFTLKELLKYELKEHLQRMHTDACRVAGESFRFSPMQIKVEANKRA